MYLALVPGIYNLTERERESERERDERDLNEYLKKNTHRVEVG